MNNYSIFIFFTFSLRVLQFRHDSESFINLLADFVYNFQVLRVCSIVMIGHDCNLDSLGLLKAEMNDC